MGEYGIKYMYPGHFFGKNLETKERVDNELTICKDVLSGKIKGQENPQGMLGLNLVINQYGVRINYNEKAIK